MKLVVLNVAYPFVPVRPDALGKAEKMLSGLDAALARSGHESFVMACEGSVTEGIHLSTPKPSEILDQAERHRIHEQYRFTLQSFVEKWPIDLIHMHGGDFYEYLPAPGVPVLVTLHMPMEWYPEKIFRLERPQTFIQCASSCQPSARPPCGNFLSLVENDFSDELPLNAATIDKYFSLYQKLVVEARGLETINPGFNDPQFALESVNA